MKVPVGFCTCRIAKSSKLIVDPIRGHSWPSINVLFIKFTGQKWPSLCVRSQSYIQMGCVVVILTRWMRARQSCCSSSLFGHQSTSVKEQLPYMTSAPSSPMTFITLRDCPEPFVWFDNLQFLRRYTYIFHDTEHLHWLKSINNI